jgi:hypothetical protein
MTQETTMINWNLSDNAAALAAWEHRARLRLCTVAPSRVYGYAHGDSHEIEAEGVVLVRGAKQEDFLRHDSAAHDSEGVTVTDTYYDVDAIGWTPCCPRTGETLTSLWIDGPTYADDGTPVEFPDWWTTPSITWEELQAMEPPRDDLGDGSAA